MLHIVVFIDDCFDQVVAIITINNIAPPLAMVTPPANIWFSHQVWSTMLEKHISDGSRLSLVTQKKSVTYVTSLK